MKPEHAPHAALESARGFTLIELLISLSAGLVVTLGVAGMAHEISNTFNEETRLAAAEAGLRTAIDRLRGDLQRASFQSTGNIYLDTLKGCPSPSLFSWVPTTTKPIQRLAGIRLYDGAQTAVAMPDKNVPTALALSATNGLAPDAIDIAGNMTGLDWFQAYPPVAGAGSGGCTRIYIDENSPAVYRILQAGTTNAPTLLRNLFQPTSSTNTGQFIVRYQDGTSHTWFLPTCAIASATGMNLSAGTGYKLWVDVAASPAVPPASSTGCGASITRKLDGWVNPVHIVRWQIEQDATGTDGLNPEGSATKYDLTRTYVDAVAGTEITETKEHVAEYAVDLKFAFSWDNEAVPLETATPRLVQYQLDDGQSRSVAPDVSAATLTAGTGPQRIRSVLVRVATREGFADRSAQLALASPGQYTTGAGPAQTYLYRYSLGSSSSSLKYARVRTVVTEVALPNQMNLYY